MNQTACRYAIIRFAPYVETGEFANIGILMLAPKQRYIDFKLLGTQRHGRITRFFDEMKPELYRETVRTLKDELKRIRDLAKGHANGLNNLDLARSLFDEAVRPRESLIRFSEARIVLADDPKEKLKALFDFYVERNFVTKEYKEAVLEKGIRRWLTEAKVGERFQRLAIGDSEYQTTFPFVEQVENRPVRVIKPLYLGQDKPGKIIEHGGIWVFRLGQLKRRHRMPEKVLFTVDGPDSNDNGRKSAFEDIVGQLKETGITVAEYNNRKRVLQFALD